MFAIPELQFKKSCAIIPTLRAIISKLCSHMRPSSPIRSNAMKIAHFAMSDRGLLVLRA